MTMNRQKQKKAILKAAKWIESHPNNWNKYDFFGTDTERFYRGFDVMGATYPNKHTIFSTTDLLSGTLEVETYISRNFPKKIVERIMFLNDTAKDNKQAARKVRAFVGAYFKQEN